MRAKEFIPSERTSGSKKGTLTLRTDLRYGTRGQRAVKNSWHLTFKWPSFSCCEYECRKVYKLAEANRALTLEMRGQAEAI